MPIFFAQNISQKIGGSVEFIYATLQTEFGKMLDIFTFAAGGVVGAVVPFDVVLFQKLRRKITRAIRNNFDMSIMEYFINMKVDTAKKYHGKVWIRKVKQTAGGG